MNAARVLPWLVFAAALAGWEALVRLAQIPHYILPAPSLVPPIEAVLRDAEGRPLYSWVSDPPRATLRPGEALHFRTRLATPPEEGRDVAVRFTTAERRVEAKR